MAQFVLKIVHFSTFWSLGQLQGQDWLFAKSCLALFSLLGLNTVKKSTAAAMRSKNQTLKNKQQQLSLTWREKQTHPSNPFKHTCYQLYLNLNILWIKKEKLNRKDVIFLVKMLCLAYKNQIMYKVILENTSSSRNV